MARNNCISAEAEKKIKPRLSISFLGWMLSYNPSFWNPRKTMIFWLAKPYYKPIKVLSDPPSVSKNSFN